MTGRMGAFVVLLIALAVLVGPTTYNHLDQSWRRRRMPAPDVQISRIRTEFGAGKPRIQFDPRNFSISVAEMNAIANANRYYYVAERGRANHVSTLVTFDHHATPPSIPFPPAPSRWELAFFRGQWSALFQRKPR